MIGNDRSHFNGKHSRSFVSSLFFMIIILLLLFLSSSLSFVNCTKRPKSSSLPVKKEKQIFTPPTMMMMMMTSDEDEFHFIADNLAAEAFAVVQAQDQFIATIADRERIDSLNRKLNSDSIENDVQSSNGAAHHHHDDNGDQEDEDDENANASNNRSRKWMTKTKTKKSMITFRKSVDQLHTLAQQLSTNIYDRRRKSNSASGTYVDRAEIERQMSRIRETISAVQQTRKTLQSQLYRPPYWSGQLICSFATIGAIVSAILASLFGLTVYHHFRDTQKEYYARRWNRFRARYRIDGYYDFDRNKLDDFGDLDDDGDRDDYYDRVDDEDHHYYYFDDDDRRRRCSLYYYYWWRLQSFVGNNYVYLIIGICLVTIACGAIAAVAYLCAKLRVEREEREREMLRKQQQHLRLIRLQQQQQQSKQSQESALM